jgi:hypothetical protein
MNLPDIKLDLYVVVNQEGKFLRAKGYGGSGKSWVDTIDQAKIYGTLGKARSQVTYWYTHFPQYGMPQIVKLNAIGSEILDETERVNKAREKKLLEKANYTKRCEEYKLNMAQEKLIEAQNVIDKLKNK